MEAWAMPEEGFDFPQYIMLCHIPLLDYVSGNIHYDPGLEVSNKGEDTEGEFRVDSKCLMPDQGKIYILSSSSDKDHVQAQRVVA